ncbi:hypothetical protein [Empedobacter sp. UBA7248]|uniref:hypothetical protein n=1 Tax=Empedobacter sp. UBA7248 TaxID=1946448 RepID=UPI0025BB7375|nr:hypothetical protein [Empedobacter sp. UBA7248]
MKYYLTYILFIICSISFSQNIDEKRDILIHNLCKILSENKNLNDLERINLVNQNVSLIKYFKDFSKDEIQAEEEAIFYRFQKNCKEYTDIIKKFSEKNNENWITLENLPKSTINDKDYNLVKSASELYYFDYEGNKTIVKIEDNNWIEYFIDESFSKLKLYWIKNNDFNLEFLESNNSMKKSFSRKGEIYQYRIVSKENNYYWIAYYTKDLNNIVKFKLYIQ